MQCEMGSELCSCEFVHSLWCICAKYAAVLSWDMVFIIWGAVALCSLMANPEPRLLSRQGMRGVVHDGVWFFLSSSLQSLLTPSSSIPTTELAFLTGLFSFHHITAKTMALANTDWWNTCSLLLRKNILLCPSLKRTSVLSDQTHPLVIMH